VVVQRLELLGESSVSVFRDFQHDVRKITEHAEWK